MNSEKIYSDYMYSYPHKTAYRNIEKIRLNDYKAFFEKNIPSLYTHIPFCVSKCGYCNLFSIVGKKEDYIERYINALKEHMELLDYKDIKIDSVIFGGGTPLILSDKLLSKMLNNMRNNHDIENSFKVIETSPNETTDNKLKILEANNFNRISIGVQSFIDSELINLKRNHNNKSIKKAINTIRNHKFDILNIDIIYGILDQTEKTLRYSIENALYYNPEEIFLYPLYIRKGSKLKKDIVDNRYNFYWKAREILLKNGYYQNSMRRFSKHNEKNNISCGFDSNISIGTGGRTYIGNIHCSTPYTNNNKKATELIENWILSKNKNVLNNGYILSKYEEKRRFVIKNILVSSGLNIVDYENAFNSSVLKDFPEIIDWNRKKWCIMKNGKITLTDIGISLSDYLGQRLISKEVLQKMKEWIDYDIK